MFPTGLQHRQELINVAVQPPNATIVPRAAAPAYGLSWADGLGHIHVAFDGPGQGGALEEAGLAVGLRYAAGSWLLSVTPRPAVAVVSRGGVNVLWWPPKCIGGQNILGPIRVLRGPRTTLRRRPASTTFLCPPRVLQLPRQASGLIYAHRSHQS